MLYLYCINSGTDKRVFDKKINIYFVIKVFATIFKVDFVLYRVNQRFHLIKRTYIPYCYRFVIYLEKL